MMYGKALTRIDSPLGALFLTVTGTTCSLKQNGDLIRLELDELRELGRDIADALAAIEARNARPPR